MQNPTQINTPYGSFAISSKDTTHIYYFAIPPPKKDPQRNRLNEYMNDIFCICNYSPLKEIELRNRNSRHFHKFDNFKPLEIHQKL